MGGDGEADGSTIWGLGFRESERAGGGLFEDPRGETANTDTDTNRSRQVKISTWRVIQQNKEEEGLAREMGRYLFEDPCGEALVRRLHPTRLAREMDTQRERSLMTIYWSRST